MRKIFILSLLLAVFTMFQTAAFAQFSLNKLRGVKTIFIDESSFQFKSSSCMQNYGKLKVVCAKHLENRLKFLGELKKWIAKYDLRLVSDKEYADAILQGELSIDDDDSTRMEEERRRDSKKNRRNETDLPSVFTEYPLAGEPLWTINSWLIDHRGEKLWSNDPLFPTPAHGWSSPAKVQAKKLAKELQVDIKKANKP